MTMIIPLGLRELDAAFLRLITDETVHVLMECCPRLERLSLHGCCEVSKAALLCIHEAWHFDDQTAHTQPTRQQEQKQEQEQQQPSYATATATATVDPG